MVRFFARTAFLACITFGAATMVASPSVWADDDGGGSDGGGSSGGGDSAGGGGGWQPGFGKPKRSASRCQCFLGFCSCARRTKAKAKVNSRRPAPVVAGVRSQELTVAGLTQSQEQALVVAGYRSMGRRDSALLATSLTRLQVPTGRSLERAIAGVREIAPDAISAANSLYRRNAIRTYRPSGQNCGARCPAFELTAWAAGHGQCAAGVTIGVVDTAVDPAHPALQGAAIDIITTRSADRPASDRSHGTGVVSLLVGDPAAGVGGLARAARIIAVDAFHGAGDRTNADAFDLIAALDSLATAGASIVNLSLTGPAHPLLEKAIAGAIARRMTLVAAAGVPDPAGRLGYPARYEGVVAVAAVDARLRPSRLSSRGDHIAWAAPGVGLTVAGRDGRLQTVDGTSFAAPFVSAAFAIGRARLQDAPTLTQTLVEGARDLGAPGRDPVFGWGLLQYGRLPTC